MAKTAQEQILDKLIAYIRANLLVIPNMEIPLEQSLLEHGIVDSFGIVELISYIEEEYQISIPDQDLTKDNFGSLMKMVAYIEKAVGMGNS